MADSATRVSLPSSLPAIRFIQARLNMTMAVIAHSSLGYLAPVEYERRNKDDDRTDTQAA